MKITKRQLRRLIREQIDQNHLDHLDDLDREHWNNTLGPATDPKHPYSSTLEDLVPVWNAAAAEPQLLKVGIEVAYGQNRIEWFIYDTDLLLARRVLNKMKRQGEQIFVKPTRYKAPHEHVTSAEDLQRISSSGVNS